MEDGRLGKSYQDGETIIREGDVGDCMYVIQSGRALVTRTAGDKKITLTELKAGDCFGEMAIIEKEVRSATVSAIGEVMVLSIDKRNFLRRVHEDPSMAYRILQHLSERIRELTEEIARLRGGD